MVTTAVITILMSIMRKMPSSHSSNTPSNTASKTSRQRLITLALVSVLSLFSLALFHSMLVSALVELGYADAAAAITVNDPEVSVLQATKYRDLAIDTINAKSVLTDQGLVITDEADAKLVKQYFQSSLDHWQQAIHQRPLWPYYQLGALEIEHFMQDDAAVKARISHIIQLAPNERGMDRGLLTMAFLSWPVVDEDDKKWLLARLNKVHRSTLNHVFSAAKKANNQREICAHLPWKKVRSLCK